MQDVVVTTEVPGQITSIHFESGDEVRAGDVLVELDASIDLAELSGLRAAERLAQLQYARAEKLQRERTMSEAQYDEAAARRSEAAALVGAKAAHVAKKTIRAPIAGTLGLRRVDLGDYLAPGAEIASLQALDKVFVDYRLPERNLARLRAGQTVDVRVQAYPDRTFTGQIAAIDPAIDVATRMVRLRARLPNPDGLLRPGMFAEVDTREEQVDDVLVVPQTAITFSPYGNSVYLIVENGEAAEGEPPAGADRRSPGRQGGHQRGTWRLAIAWSRWARTSSATISRWRLRPTRRRRPAAP